MTPGTRRALAQERSQGLAQDLPVVPRATYRLQFHRGFRFDDATAILPYLARLGVSHVYASPILASRPGSTHGYDLVDYESINPELGGEAAFLRFCDALTAHGLGLVVDIVPNHMAVGGHGNHWWQSVLEWGRASAHARAFDIDWSRRDAHGKLILPILDAPYGEVLERGELKLAFDSQRGSLFIRCGEHVLPLSLESYGAILADAASKTARGLKEVEDRLREAAREASLCRKAASGEKLKRRLVELAARDAPFARAVRAAIETLNGQAGDPRSFDALDAVIARQHWRATDWRMAASDLNYRRFFDINLLAGIRSEDPRVFDATHRLILRWVEEGRVQGLRIDHIDGLADPLGYLERLRRAIGPRPYLVVEKILEPGEELRPWPVAGTTGYDSLNLIDAVLLDPRSEEICLRLYDAAAGKRCDYQGELAAAKCLIIENSFAGELESLVGDLKIVADAGRRTRDHARQALRAASLEILVAFPVYRSYVEDGPIGESDRELLIGAIRAAKETSGLSDIRVHDFILAVLVSSGETRSTDKAARHAARFCRRFQQLSGPVMAKSLEDTAFYRYVPLIALNEVGGDPGRFGIEVQDFHAAISRRAADWPNAMIATQTHDTKRAEDARSRLLAMGEDPSAPDAVDRLLLLQSILGAWPLELMSDATRQEASLAPFLERICAFAPKALREAKRHTSWMKPNLAYEEAALTFLIGLLVQGALFEREIGAYARRLAYLGMLNGLTRTALKFTLPGVPDIYQGSECWDFSLVDPDNRRPVDYGARSAGLDDARDIPALLRDWRSGTIKQRLTRLLLADRGATPVLYERGDYRPHSVEGARGNHVIAFSRRHAAERLLAICARLPGPLVAGEELPVGAAWRDTCTILPPGPWRDVLSGAEIEGRGDPVGLDRVLATLPVAVLRSTHSEEDR
jgi:(1->4)-alpha-D-glucan 1-alpha-D-glucosylmutase